MAALNEISSRSQVQPLVVFVSIERSINTLIYLRASRANRLGKTAGRATRTRQSDLTAPHNQCNAPISLPVCQSISFTLLLQLIPGRAMLFNEHR